MPAYNEEDLLEASVQRLLGFMADLGRPFELLVGSNGSLDQTQAIGARLAGQDERVRFFHLEQRGPGGAFARALDLARYPLLITLDADLSVDLAFVPQALEHLESHQIVVGSKFQGLQERTWQRVLGSGLYIGLVLLLLGMPYRDYSIGAKGFQRQLPLRHPGLIDAHTAYVGNLIYAAHCQGLPIKEIPVACSDLRPSRFNLPHEGLYRVGWVLRLFWRHRLRRLPLG